MNRTRKWDFVAQEAQRLAALGLNANQIAKRLKVNRSTATRWLKSGRLTPSAGVMPPTGITTAVAPMTPQDWSKTVRSSYQLDATDDQLVTIAESALQLSLDASVSAGVRMSAAARFQSLVKQLAFKTPMPADIAKPEPATREHRRREVDPRHLLQAVK